MLRLRFYLVSLLFLVACTPASNQQSAYDNVIAVEQAFMAAFKHADSTCLAKLYSEDAQLLPANRDFVSGRHDIKLFWQGLMQLGITAVKLETLEVDGSEGRASEVGRYTIHTADDEMIDYGKYLVVWRQHEGQWFIHRHIWTTSMIKAHESRI